jgi:hypothetical protein
VSNGDWPAPEPHEERPRLPLPRVDDLPIAEQGYDREAVREAFDAFYRHAAQLDATLRTLEAVEVFQRTASELRAEMRTIRAGGWTVSSYGRGGYGGTRGGGAGMREWSLPPAFPRIAAEALFLIVIGIVVGVAGWSRIAIVLVMGLALAIVWLVEFVASRERAVPRTAVAPPQPPRLDEEPAELPAGEAEEGPEAITILGAAEPSRSEEEEPAGTQAEEEPEPEPEPLEPEAVAEAEPEPARAEADEEPEREPEPPPEVQVPPPSPIVSPGGAPPIPAPVPPVRDEPEPTAAEEAELAAAAVDAGDEIDEAPEAELAEELVAQSHKVDPAPETALAEPPEPREEELVAQSHKVDPAVANEALVVEPESERDADAELEAAPVGDENAVDEEALDEEAPAEEASDEDTLTGIEAVPAEPQRRRFSLFRRGGEDNAEPEAKSEPEAVVVDPWVVPTSERPADEYDAPAAAEAEAVDPWERGPDLHPVAEPLSEEDTPPPRARGWFSRREESQDLEEPEPELEPEPLELIVEPEPELGPELEPEPEPVEPLIEADAEPDADDEGEEREEDQEPQEPRASDLPVEVLAEQAAAAIDRSRARRRRPPRRARRR